MIALDPRQRQSCELAVNRRIGEIDVSVRSTQRAVLDDFAAIYEGFPDPPAAASTAIAVEVRRLGHFLGSCRVFGGGEAVGPAVPPEHALPFVEWGINYQLVSKCAGFLQVHAAVLSRCGSGALFAAQSGSGKSTLAAGLITRGWKYLSDEIALIDPDSLRVHPFPKALCIKSGAFPEIRNLDLPFAGRRYYVKGVKGQVAYVNPLCLGRQALAAPCPIRYVILPRYVPGSTPRLLRISHAQAAFELARNSMNRSRFGSKALDLFTGVARQSECFALRAGPLRETGVLLEEMVDGNLY